MLLKVERKMEQAIEEITQTLKTTVIPNFVDILSKKYVDMVSEKFNIPKDELNKCTKPLIEQLIKYLKSLLGKS